MSKKVGRRERPMVLVESPPVEKGGGNRHVGGPHNPSSPHGKHGYIQSFSPQGGLGGARWQRPPLVSIGQPLLFLPREAAIKSRPIPNDDGSNSGDTVEDSCCVIHIVHVYYSPPQELCSTISSVHELHDVEVGLAVKRCDVGSVRLSTSLPGRWRRADQNLSELGSPITPTNQDGAPSIEAKNSRATDRADVSETSIRMTMPLFGGARTVFLQWFPPTPPNAELDETVRRAWLTELLSGSEEINVELRALVSLADDAIRQLDVKDTLTNTRTMTNASLGEVGIGVKPLVVPLSMALRPPVEPDEYEMVVNGALLYSTPATQDGTKKQPAGSSAGAQGIAEANNTTSSGNFPPTSASDFGAVVSLGEFAASSPQLSSGFVQQSSTAVNFGASGGNPWDTAVDFGPLVCPKYRPLQPPAEETHVRKRMRLQARRLAEELQAQADTERTARRDHKERQLDLQEFLTTLALLKKGGDD